jgi:putative ABC transport system substrate-binding protein
MNRSRRGALLALGTLLPLAAIAPPTARAAPGAGMKRVVLVRFAFRETTDGDNLDEVLARLGKRGVQEGRDISVHRLVIDFREVEGPRRLDYVTDRIRQEGMPLRPDLFLTEGTGFTEAIRKVTRTVPIVTSVADPVASGFAASLARPGGNVTGLAQGVAETAGKSIEIVRRLVPRLARLAVFHGAGAIGTRFARHYERAARAAGIEPEMYPTGDEASLVAAIRRAASSRVPAGMLTISDGYGAPGARSAVEARLPLVGHQEHLTDSGCLASYYAWDPDGPDRLAAVAEKVIRGGDPATIPFQYPLTYRLVLNRRTAAALGIELPADLLLRADRVIE